MIGTEAGRSGWSGQGLLEVPVEVMVKETSIAYGRRVSRETGLVAEFGEDVVYPPSLLNQTR